MKVIERYYLIRCTLTPNSLSDYISFAIKTLIHRYTDLAETLRIQRKTLSNQSINQSIIFDLAKHMGE